MSKTKFEVYKDKQGGYRWRLLSQNKEIVATGGESYTEKRGAMNAVKKLKDWSNTTNIVDIEKEKEEALKAKTKASAAKKVAAKPAAKKSAAKPAAKAASKKAVAPKPAAKKPTAKPATKSAAPKANTEMKDNDMNNEVVKSIL